MIQFNIQFKIKSKIFIQTFINSIWKKTSGLKHVLTTQIRTLASTFFCHFPHCMPFFTLYTCFSYFCLTISQTSKHSFYISFIFPMNDAFFSFIQQFIQFYKENYSFKKLLIQKIWNHSFKEIIHSFEKWIIAQG